MSAKIMPQAARKASFPRHPNGGVTGFAFTYSIFGGTHICIVAPTKAEVMEYATELLRQKGTIPDESKIQPVRLSPP